jgi:hypothetical protein
MVVPQISLNLISGPRLDIDGFELSFKDGKGLIRKGNHIIRGYLYKNLYFCNLSDFVINRQLTNPVSNLAHEQIRVAPQIKVLPTPASQRPQKKLPTISSSADLELLHKRFGHASIEAIVKGLRDKTITGYTVEAKRTDGKYSLQNGVCNKCMLTK